MRTTEELGRWGCVNAQEAAANLAAMSRARNVFADLSRSLEGEIDRLKGTLETEMDKKRAEHLIGGIDQCRKALLTVLSIEDKLMRGAELPHSDQGVIDLAEARDEVERRLDRLAERGGPAHVPG